jgi:transcriptional regulator EpsA
MNVKQIWRNDWQDARFCQKLKTPVSKIFKSIDLRGCEVRPSNPWSIDMNPGDSKAKFSHVVGEESFGLTSEEAAKYLRIISQAQLITRHHHLFVWLRGEFQEFLPHEIFISAWGNFSDWDLKLDVISELPKVRTGQLEHARIDEFLSETHLRWVEGKRRPLILTRAEVLDSLETGATPLHTALRTMQSIMVHGVRDERGGHDSLYLALSRGSFTKGRGKERFSQLADSLIAQVDVAFRRVAAYPLARTAQSATPRTQIGSDGRELSAREEEILDWLCEGKTNVEIAATLKISPYTVKNHVQRIFRKIGVTSRMQAATKYSQALGELRRYLELSKDLD